MNWKWLVFSLLSIILILPEAGAMKLSYRTLKKKAYFIQNNGDLYESLDLRRKRFKFNPADFQACGRQLLRQPNTLSYSCTLELKGRQKISKLREQMSPKEIRVTFGGSPKAVRIKVSPDAKAVTFSTAFDDTGVDYDVSKFNEEFFNVYAKVAQIVLAEAMDKRDLIIKTLEN